MSHRIEPGSLISWKDQDWILLDIPEMSTALVRHPTSGKVELVQAAELRSTRIGGGPTRSVVGISKSEWEVAWTRLQALRPLLSRKPRDRTAEEIDQIAAQLNKNRATIYRWIARWETTGTVSSLARKGRNDVGKSRLDPAIEEIIRFNIDNYFLKPERPPVVDVWEDIQVACRAQGVKAPDLSTVRRRIANLQDRLVMSKRFSEKKAREHFSPLKGLFPGADVPLAVYQIDHTPIDVMFVDELYRRPIGRGTLTIVGDTCTRMLAGFCITLDPPGALSTGLAMAHAILPKSQWLMEQGVDATWPIYGLPTKVFADNAAEFRGLMLGRACEEHNIILENRPVGLPNFGGYIERLFRTFMKKAHRISGTTFSNSKEKGEYDSEGRAVMTIKEFERWFTVFVTKVYHQRRHRGIGYVPPIKLYEQFILGTEHTKGIGLPEPIHNEFKLKMDFMPFVERTVQEYGVLVDHIRYYADVLRTWIHARDTENSKYKRKFIFARDPRDISVIYFFDPETKLYHPIPYQNVRHPSMSIWDLNAILDRIAKHPDLQPNEDLIFEGYAELRQIEQASAEKTKSARRQQQRRAAWNNNARPQPVEHAIDTMIDETWEDTAQPFEDIEESA